MTIEILPMFLRGFASSGVPAPVTSFSANVISGNAPLAVTFTDTSTNAPTSWVWDFGDGFTDTTQNPVHTYAVSGTYTVILTSTNTSGSNTLTKTAYIVVSSTGGMATLGSLVLGKTGLG